MIFVCFLSSSVLLEMCCCNQPAQHSSSTSQVADVPVTSGAVLQGVREVQNMNPASTQARCSIQQVLE